jgi:hypothetical protein
LKWSRKVPQNEGPGWQETSYNQEMRLLDPDSSRNSVKKKKMQVGDIQDESQDESRDEAMPHPGAEHCGKYDFLSVLKSIFFLQNRRSHQES